MRGAQTALAYSFATLLCVTAVAPSAEACSFVTPGGCQPAIHFPGTGRLVPANLPAIGVAFPPGTPGVWIELRDANGALVEGVVETEQESLLRFYPAAPLHPDTDYALVYPEPCGQGGSDAGEVVSVSFHAGPAVDLPTSLGTARVSQYRFADLEGDLDNTTCRAVEVRGVIAQLELEMTPELEAYLPVARFVTTLDGKPWSGSSYGGFFSAGSSYGPTSREVGWIFAECDGTVHHGTTLGKHTVTVTASIEGAPDVELAASTSVELTCEASAGDEIAGDASVGGESGGCTIGGSAGRTWALLVVAIVALASRRIRRSG